MIKMKITCTEDQKEAMWSNILSCHCPASIGFDKDMTHGCDVGPDCGTCFDQYIDFEIIEQEGEHEKDGSI